MSQSLIVEVEQSIATITISRPARYNALDLDTMSAFAEALTGLARDDGVRAVVITGAGAVFSSGGDVKWALSFDGGAAAAFYQLAARFHLAITEIRSMPKPVIAAINGVAAGGGFSLALACDFRVMAADAVLRQAYSSQGLSMDGGATHTLPRLVGFARALEIAAFDAPIPAETAREWGLITEMAAAGDALPAGLRMARLLAATSWHSFACAKALLATSFDTPLEAQLQKERNALALCAAHADGGEGLQAFVEKRAANFNRRPGRLRS